jgi:divalent metal cation (Fe/Co/Zn/Cd) transporter
LFLAVVGVTAAEISGNSRWDALGSVGIGILLGVIAIVLATEMKSLLIGESASGSLVDAISSAITDGREVLRVIHLRTLHLGPDELLVAAKVEIDAPSVADLARAIDAAEARVRAAVPIARVIYLEPDVYRSDAVMDR